MKIKFSKKFNKQLGKLPMKGDIRALYEVVDGEMYLYDMIGSHSQLYG